VSIRNKKIKIKKPNLWVEQNLNVCTIVRNEVKRGISTTTIDGGKGLVNKRKICNIRETSNQNND